MDDLITTPPQKNKNKQTTVSCRYSPNASIMPDGLPIVRGRSPGVVLVPGVGASFLGVGVFDFKLGVDDLSF